MRKFTIVLSLVFIVSCMISSYTTTTAQAVGYQTNQSGYNSDVSHEEYYKKLNRKIENIDTRLTPIEHDIEFFKNTGLVVWIVVTSLSLILSFAAIAR